MIQLHIGFDDTDSPKMGCTTYVAALLVEKLHKLGASFTDYPNLIRLNPNVPWKTRGNGALCLRIRCREDLIEEVKDITIDTIEEHADLSHAGTDPGVVFFSNHVSSQVETFASAAIRGIVKLKEALRLVRMSDAEAVGFKKGRGIIGGLAAIGERLYGDHTYEIIAYRTRQSRGTPRRIEPSSVIEMNKKTAPLTFNNLDQETNRILITPRGPDPILYGIRGESPEIVRRAHEIVRAQEPVERWTIFRTNHGTDAHLQKISTLSEIKPFNPVVTRGTIAKQPKIIPGGHVIFKVKDKRVEVECAAYKPTGVLKEIAKELISGDLLEISGGVRPASSKHPITVNLEKLRVLKMAPEVTFHNPICSKCGKRTKSMGKGQGLRCKKCGFRSSELKKITLRVDRNLRKGLYVTSPRSQRHLTKPLCRYGREKSGAPSSIFKDWHFP